MPVPLDLNLDVNVRGSVTFGGSIFSLTRTKIQQEDLSEFNIPIEDWRIWNAYQTLLTGTANTDDLAITAVAFGTGTPYISCGDVNADASATRYARFQVQLPMNYVAGETVQIRFYAGLFSGTAAIGTITVDLEAYETGATTGALVNSVDLCATSAITINSLTFAACDFTITPTALVAGDMLDCRVAINFSNDATARVPAILYAKLLCDTKG